MVIVN